MGDRATPPEPPPLEPTIGEYMARLAADEQAQHHVLVVEAQGLEHLVGPFATVEAAFGWNEHHRAGADAKVRSVHAPWRPWREPRR